tara:strand:- start:4240 stop:4884 length:645 start_codon:yes stop_codon:yes gene_type:complete
MALCSVSDVEQFLQVDLNSTVEASVTNTFIPYVDSAIKRFLGYDVETATHTETFDGNEQQDLFLRHIPIASITSVTEDGNTLTQGNEDDYVYYDNGRLRRIVVRWSGIKPKNISVTYVGGYAANAIPPVIKNTSAKAAARMLMTALQIGSKADTGQVGSHLADNTASSTFDIPITERIGDYDVAYADVVIQNLTPVLTQGDMLILNPFKSRFFV